MRFSSTHYGFFFSKNLRVGGVLLGGDGRVALNTEHSLGLYVANKETCLLPSTGADDC